MIFILTSILPVLITVKYRLRWYVLFPEILICTATGIVSALYHACSNGPFCTKWCLGYTIPNGEYQSPMFNQLQHWDFIMSYIFLVMAFGYTTDRLLWPSKVVYLIIGFLFGYGYCNTPNFGHYDTQFCLFLVGYGVVFTAYKYWYTYEPNEYVHLVKYHFDKTMGCIALLCLIIGIIIYEAFNPLPFQKYGWGHACWHISTGSAMYALFGMYDRNLALPCFPERDLCPLCAGVGGPIYRNPSLITHFCGISVIRWGLHDNHDTEYPPVQGTNPGMGNDQMHPREIV